jgi:hypothetical protein
LNTNTPHGEHSSKLFLSHHLLGEMPETRDVAIATLLLFLKPAFVPCSTLAGPGLDALPVAHAATFPSSAYNLFDLMPELPGDVVPLPLHQARNRDAVYDYETKHGVLKVSTLLPRTSTPSSCFPFIHPSTSPTTCSTR